MDMTSTSFKLIQIWIMTKYFCRLNKENVLKIQKIVSIKFYLELTKKVCLHFERPTKDKLMYAGHWTFRRYKFCIESTTNINLYWFMSKRYQSAQNNLALWIMFQNKSTLFQHLVKSTKLAQDMILLVHKNDYNQDVFCTEK